MTPTCVSWVHCRKKTTLCWPPRWKGLHCVSRMLQPLSCLMWHKVTGSSDWHARLPPLPQRGPALAAPPSLRTSDGDQSFTSSLPRDSLTRAGNLIDWLQGEMERFLKMYATLTKQPDKRLPKRDGQRKHMEREKLEDEETCLYMLKERKKSASTFFDLFSFFFSFKHSVFKMNNSFSGDFFFNLNQYNRCCSKV